MKIQKSSDNSKKKKNYESVTKASSSFVARILSLVYIPYLQEQSPQVRRLFQSSAYLKIGGDKEISLLIERHIVYLYENFTVTKRSVFF